MMRKVHYKQIPHEVRSFIDDYDSKIDITTPKFHQIVKARTSLCGQKDNVRMLENG